MAYTVYSGERCTRSAFDNSRCALTDGHHGLHTTAAGGLFSTQGGRYLSGDPLLATRSVENATQVAASMQCQNGTGAWQCVRVRGHDGLHVREPHPASALEQRIDVLREATLTNVEQLSERIERLEKDLRDTHDLAERAATAHLERKPEEWNADSGEPSRLRRYQDSRGCVWEYSSSRYGWHWEKNPDDLRRLVGPFIPWDGLRSDRRADFPWKVWTNG